MLVLLLLAALGCKNSKYCSPTQSCGAGMVCDVDASQCLPTDGGGTGGRGGAGGHGGGKASCQVTGCDGGGLCDPDGGMCVECLTSADCPDPSKAICDSATHTCGPCSSGGTQCQAHPSIPACVGGSCVECATSADCPPAAAATPDKTKPVCGSSNTCRACQTDAECVAKSAQDPGVCMADGHCAASGEVLFVQFSAGGCPGATGAPDKPFCAPNDAVAHLGGAASAIVIIGAASSSMTLSPTTVAPIVLGRADPGGAPASIPATVGAALTVSSGSATIRYVTVNVGTTNASKGVVVTGSGTTARLTNVTANLGTGVGIDAENGASLLMDRCVVENNSVGGVLVNGASYTVQNSIIAGNGYGVKFTASAVSTGSQFWFNTVIGNAGSAVTCDPNNAQILSDSVIAGLNDSCSLANSFTTAPAALKASAPYYLTGAIGCPTTAAASFPTYDVEGHVRSAPTDCDADQFFP